MHSAVHNTIHFGMEDKYSVNRWVFFYWDANKLSTKTTLNFIYKVRYFYKTQVVDVQKSAVAIGCKHHVGALN